LLRNLLQIITAFTLLAAFPSSKAGSEVFQETELTCAVEHSNIIVRSLKDDWFGLSIQASKLLPDIVFRTDETGTTIFGSSGRPHSCEEKFNGYYCPRSFEPVGAFWLSKDLSVLMLYTITAQSGKPMMVTSGAKCVRAFM